jgi:hypothetical protein
LGKKSSDRSGFARSAADAIVKSANQGGRYKRGEWLKVSFIIDLPCGKETFKNGKDAFPQGSDVFYKNHLYDIRECFPHMLVFNAGWNEDAIASIIAMNLSGESNLEASLKYVPDMPLLAPMGLHFFRVLYQTQLPTRLPHRFEAKASHRRFPRDLAKIHFVWNHLSLQSQIPRRCLSLQSPRISMRGTTSARAHG